MFLAYLRCSTLKQLKEKSIDVQKELVQRYAEHTDLGKTKYYVDEGISAAKDRPAFNRLMRDLGKEDVVGVVTPDLTRFGRDTVELLVSIKKITEQEKKFIAINNNIDTSTPEGRLYLTILAAIAEYERYKIRERLELGKAYAKEHGTKSGKPMHRPKLDLDIEEIKKLRKMGASQNFIANLLGVSRQTIACRKLEHGIE